MGKELRLEELEVYNVAMEIGEIVWTVVEKWNYFPRRTLGAHFMEAADSIALNVSEGYDRFHFQDNKFFCFYSWSSAIETLTTTRKAKSIGMISEENFHLLMYKLDSYFRLIHSYTSFTGNQHWNDNC